MILDYLLPIVLSSIKNVTPPFYFGHSLPKNTQVTEKEEKVLQIQVFFSK